jgi:hypothetical protein
MTAARRGPAVEHALGWRWRFALALTIAILSPPASQAGDRFRLHAIIEGRLVTMPASPSFLDGGLGKTRYGHDLAFTVQANVDAEHDFKRRADVVEAFARYTPAMGDRLSLDFRAGLFFPAVSLENTDPGWLSPCSTT